MKFTKQDLLTLLIGLFLFASCKDENTIGLNPDTDQTFSGSLIDTATVTSQTLLDDVTSGVGLTRHPLGYITDPVFGKSFASISMSLGIPSAAFRFGTNANIDSAVLVLPYGTQFYGDTTTSVYALQVKQLASDLSQEKSFQTNITFPTTGAALGTYSGKIQPNTKFKITSIVAGGPDTAITVVPQIRIKLNNTFVQTNIIKADTLKYDDLNSFFRYFKGLQVTASATNQGGIMFFNFTGTDARVDIYYKRQNATTTTAIDTVMTSFPISTSTGPVTATVGHDYTGTVIKTQLDNPTVKYQVTYLQALAGLKNKISFPYLKSFVADLKAKNGANAKVLVNKAQLVVDLNDGTDVAPFNAAQRLSLYNYDIAGQRANLIDNPSGTSTTFGGYFDSVNKRYIFSITDYIQSLVNGSTDYGTFLAPSSLTEFNLTPSVTSSARSVIKAYKAGASSGEKRLKLNIFYTIVN
ncbi:DUF4270 family protein [Pedobacter sp. MC2016-24]|uniref:DUF4270 family protein n=1 Tax=Pedobacter sp. MC2016-24 TaxID=2780090 RepID=UPI001882DC22|nr:DUF4270 family protein [Pedobacter sp. MC2016-24]MBE9598786.1 DUF4270 domain-containing protein [Pedobacter sp. MC2016-24]